MRIAYHLFTQRPKDELDDFKRWSQMVKPGQGDDFFRLNGAGEMLVYSAATSRISGSRARTCRRTWSRT